MRKTGFGSPEAGFQGSEIESPGNNDCLSHLPGALARIKGRIYDDVVQALD